MIDENNMTPGGRQTKFSRATTVMVIVGTILVVVALCQWFVNNLFMTQDIAQRAQLHLETAANTTLHEIETIMEQSAEDIKIIQAHQGIRNYFTAVYFEDIDEMTLAVSEFEAFLTQIYKAKPKYSKMQLATVEHGEILQINKGIRVESFDRFSEIIGKDHFQKISQHVTQDTIAPPLFHESYLDPQDGWVVLSVSPISTHDLTEGLLWLSQPVEDLFDKTFMELQKAEIACVIANDQGEIITQSQSINKALLNGFLTENPKGWLITEKEYAPLGWKIIVGMPKKILYAQQKKFNNVGLFSFFISLGLAMAALWGLKVHQDKLEKRIALDEKKILDKNFELEKALAELNLAQTQLITKKDEIEEDRSKIQEALDEIFSLIQRVSEAKHFGIKFIHPNLKKCWEFTKCNSTKCPCYGQVPMRCWQIVGNYSSQPDSNAKCIEMGNDCLNCDFYKEVTYDPIFQIGEQFNNMMHILETQNMKLEKAYTDLKASQLQLLQQEKMATVGTLAAGVAHEINNPLGFILSNMRALKKYIDRILEFMLAQTDYIEEGPNELGLEKLKLLKKEMKLDYISTDIQDLLNESLDGAERVKDIVQGLKNFSRVDQAERQSIDINECLDSTIKIVWNEIKYKATVNKEFSKLPQTFCYPQQLNQAFLNFIINASHAIEKQGVITLKSYEQDGNICVEITDTGKGIPPDIIENIFEPFFTTKEVGTGTGLGLSIVYDIIVKNHKGNVTVQSEEGIGTTFTVQLPVLSE